MGDRAGLNVELAGVEHGEPMLLVHGFLSCNAQWDLNREALGRHLRLVMVELPGHGDSAAPDDPSFYGVASVLAELERIRGELGINRWWVCGQSLGAAVTMNYVLEHPEVAIGYVFTNSRAVFGVRRKDAEAAGTAEPPPVAAVRDLPFHPINAKRFPQTVKDRMVAAADRMPLHVISHVTGHRDSWAAVDRFGELEMPVLLVNGRWESRFQKSVPLAHAAIGDLRVVELEGGHSINVEQPEGFNTAVLEFVGARRD